MDEVGTVLLWVTTAILAGVIPIWAFYMVNKLWLRPKRLERLLMAQGLRGDPYKLLLSPGGDKKTSKLQLQTKSTATAAPCISSVAQQTLDKYGKNSYFWDGTKLLVIITDPAKIKEVLSKMNDFPKPKLSNPIARYFSNGLASYEGEKWATHRKIINPAFHFEKLKDMLPAFLETSQDMISKWNGMLSSDGTCDIDVWPSFEDLSRDAISKTAFGSSYEEGTQIFQLLKRLGYLILTSSRYAKIPLWWLLPTRTNKMIKKIKKDMHESLMGIIEKRKESWKNGETTKDDDLLGTLLQANDIEKRMTIEEVIVECRLFYLAGQETVADLLVWTMVLLAKYPEWQARAREEVLQVFGNQIPNFQGLSHLKVVTMVLYEVLRLYPPSINIDRALEKDVKLGDLSLPAGVRISIPLLLVHHDHDIWGDDAKEFNPERFSEGIAKATKGRVCYFPFGWGPRICIGQNFVLLEAKIVFSMLLQNFSFQLSPTYAHEPTNLLTLKPKHGANIILHRLPA